MVNILPAAPLGTTDQMSPLRAAVPFSLLDGEPDLDTVFIVWEADWPVEVVVPDEGDPRGAIQTAIDAVHEYLATPQPSTGLVRHVAPAPYGWRTHGFAPEAPNEDGPWTSVYGPQPYRGRYGVEGGDLSFDADLPPWVRPAVSTAFLAWSPDQAIAVDVGVEHRPHRNVAGVTESWVSNHDAVIRSWGSDGVERWCIRNLKLGLIRGIQRGLIVLCGAHANDGHGIAVRRIDTGGLVWTTDWVGQVRHVTDELVIVAPYTSTDLWVRNSMGLPSIEPPRWMAFDLSDGKLRWCITVGAETTGSGLRGDVLQLGPPLVAVAVATGDEVPSPRTHISNPPDPLVS